MDVSKCRDENVYFRNSDLQGYIIKTVLLQLWYHHSSLIQRKHVFAYVQYVRIHIILCMRKVSSGTLLSIDTVYSIKWFWKRSVKALIRLRLRTGWPGPSMAAYARGHVFAWRSQFDIGRLTRSRLLFILILQCGSFDRASRVDPLTTIVL